MERDRGIDALKAIAIFGVVVIHACTAGYYRPIGSFGWISTLFWGSAARASVPIFFLCSGALFLPPEKPLPLKKLYGRNILRILLAMFFWSFLYKLYHLLDTDALSPSSAFEALKQILLFKQDMHFYFLHILLLFYALLPVLRVFVGSASENELRYGLGIWFLLGILYPTLRPFWPFRLLSGIPAEWLMNMAYASAGYGLLGWYLKSHRLSLRAGAVSAAAGFLVTFGGTFYLSVRRAALDTGLLSGMSVGPALMAAGIFGLCQNRSSFFSRGFIRATEYLSRASFCVYLVHVLFLDLLAERGVNALTLTPLAAVPLLSALVLLLCCAVYAVLSKLPFVRRWLV